MNAVSTRVAAATGAVYVVALIAGASLYESRSTVVARTGYALVVLGFTAFIVFIGFLHRRLRDAEGPGGWLATVALGAGLLHLAIRFQAQVPLMIKAYRGDALSSDLARTVEDFNSMAFVITGLLIGVYCAAAGRVCLAHRVLPGSLAGFGVVIGVSAVAAGVVGMTAPELYLPWPYLLALIWTAIVSVLLTIRPVRGASAPDLHLAAHAPVD